MGGKYKQILELSKNYVCDLSPDTVNRIDEEFFLLIFKRIIWVSFKFYLIKLKHLITYLPYFLIWRQEELI